MSRQNRKLTSLADRLRPTAADFAGAAAPHDPSLLLALEAAQTRDEPASIAPREELHGTAR
jgi:hypothetical protein